MSKRERIVKPNQQKLITRLKLRVKGLSIVSTTWQQFALKQLFGLKQMLLLLHRVMMDHTSLTLIRRNFHV